MIPEISHLSFRRISQTIILADHRIRIDDVGEDVFQIAAAGAVEIGADFAALAKKGVTLGTGLHENRPAARGTD